MKYNFRNYIVLQQLRVHGRNTVPVLHALTSRQAITAPTDWHSVKCSSLYRPAECWLSCAPVPHYAAALSGACLRSRHCSQAKIAGSNKNIVHLLYSWRWAYEYIQSTACCLRLVWVDCLSATAQCNLDIQLLCTLNFQCIHFRIKKFSYRFP